MTYDQNLQHITTLGHVTPSNDLQQIYSGVEGQLVLQQDQISKSKSLNDCMICLLESNTMSGWNHTYAALRVLHGSAWVLVHERSTAFTLRPRPVIAAVVTHSATDTACRIKTSSIEMTRVRVAVAVAS